MAPRAKRQEPVEITEETEIGETLSMEITTEERSSPEEGSLEVLQGILEDEGTRENLEDPQGPVETSAIDDSVTQETSEETEAPPDEQTTESAAPEIQEITSHDEGTVETIIPEVTQAPLTEEKAEAPRAAETLYFGKYEASEKKNGGKAPKEFKYLHVALYPGHKPKGMTRDVKEGAKPRRDSAFTVMWKMADFHYGATGTGILGSQLLEKMMEYDWRGTNSPYCDGGRPPVLWCKDYIVGACRVNNQTLMTAEQHTRLLEANAKKASKS